jgi:hypothetical protein
MLPLGLKNIQAKNLKNKKIKDVKNDVPIKI